jgi:hypothetical protein
VHVPVLAAKTHTRAGEDGVRVEEDNASDEWKHAPNLKRVGLVS